MHNLSRRGRLSVLLLSCSLIGALAPRAVAENAPGPVAVDQLETQAGDAIHSGNFDRGSELLNQAASLGQDPAVKRLAAWATDFESQQKTFAAERQKAFEKNVSDVHLLIDHHMQTYAIDLLQQAYLRCPDKKAFRAEKWVDDLIKSAGNDAAKAEMNDQWVTALRIYSDLTGVDPYEPLWKQKLKSVTRRIRMLVLYTPDQFKTTQKSEIDARKAADALLHPTTQPTTEPVADDDNPEFKMDWHDVVRGASFDMLQDTLFDAEHDYYKPVDLQTMMLGGIDELKNLTTTGGLDHAFTGLGNQQKRSDFLWALDKATTDVKQITPDNEENTVHTILAGLLSANQNSINLPDEVFVTEFTDGALDELDPFTSMIWPYDLSEFLQTTQGDFTGVGIQIEASEDGSLRVVSPLEDTPAYKAGIKAGDVITRIDGRNAHGITANEAVKTITGPAHTIVNLTVRSPDGTVRVYPIERQKINVVSVKGYSHLRGGGWDYFIDPQNKIGYLRLTNFTAKSSGEMSAALESLRHDGAKALILDLRYNPGGLLDAAVDISSDFLRSGIVVSTHPDRETEYPPSVAEAHPGDDTTDIPLAVLVNQYSASASEIVSGALKDHGRATIIGERTFGKGSVQRLVPLSNKSALLKMTTSHYYLPSGRCLHREENSTVWGVDPDVTIEMTPEQMRAAIDARTEMEVLRDRDANAAAAKPTTQPDFLASDPQLSGALLVLRLKLAGVQI